MLGHKTVHKVLTGEKMSVVGRLGNKHDILLSKFEKTRFCTRCGEPVASNNSIDQKMKGD